MAEVYDNLVEKRVYRDRNFRGTDEEYYSYDLFFFFFFFFFFLKISSCEVRVSAQQTLVAVLFFMYVCLPPTNPLQ